MTTSGVLVNVAATEKKNTKNSKLTKFALLAHAFHSDQNTGLPKFASILFKRQMGRGMPTLEPGPFLVPAEISFKCQELEV